MRFSEETRFPHPVLWLETGDYSDGKFDADFTPFENLEDGSLTIKYKVWLTEPAIRRLVEKEAAVIGCFVRCSDTFFTELKHLSWPEGRSDFAAGKLLNRVSLRPIIWLNENLTNWDSGTINQEFSPPITLDKGNIIAIGSETIISVGQAKLTSIESIFALEHSKDIPEGSVRVDVEYDRITILASPNTFNTICQLRGQRSGQQILINAVYLPAVMEVLDILCKNKDGYQDRRWYPTFIAKCDAKGIELSNGDSILENAQKLLDSPINLLGYLEGEME